MLQHPHGLSEALCQKCNSDLCCCFSCFCAGPERAVHTTRDGSPNPRQPDPSHREKRYIRVNRPTHSSVVCLASPSFRLRVTVSLPPSASCSHASICTSVDIYRAVTQMQKFMHILTVPPQLVCDLLQTFYIEVKCGLSQNCSHWLQWESCTVGLIHTMLLTNSAR